LIKNELEGIWKEADIACPKCYPHMCPEGQTKATKYLNEGSKYLDRDSNPAPQVLYVNSVIVTEAKG
jgi:hypothetical protein